MNIYKKQIEQITIIGKRPEEMAEAFDICHNENYRVIQSGPKPIARYKFSSTLFRIVAQRKKDIVGSI